MKKLLSITLALTLSLGVAAGLAACGKEPVADAAATTSITSTLNTLYYGSKVTDSDYTVIGSVKAGGKSYSIHWSAESEDVEKISDYVKIASKADKSGNIKVGITRTNKDIEYKLKASFKTVDGSKELAYPRTITEKAPEGTGESIESPYSVAQVFDIASKMTPKTKLEASDNPKRVYVAGYIVDCGSDQGTSNRVGYVKIVDKYVEGMNGNSDGALMILSINYGTILTGHSDLKVGAKIIVSGYIMNYQKNATSDPYGEITYYGDNGIQCEYLEKEEQTPDEKVATAKDAVSKLLVKTTYTETGLFDLPQTHNNGATYTWSVPTNNYVEISDNNLNVKEIPDDEETITLTVNVNYTGATEQSTTISIKVGEPEFTPITQPVAGTYKFAMQKPDGKYYYMTGEMDGYYFGTTTNRALAADVVLEQVGTSGWLLKQDNRYIEIVKNDTFNNVVFNATQTTGKYWQWNETYEIFTWELEGTTFWLGTSTYYTFSANDLTKLSGSSSSSQCPAKLGIASAAPAAPTGTFTPITAPAAGTEYYMSMEVSGKNNYVTGEITGNNSQYLATTTDISSAGKVTLEADGDGWNIKVNGKYLEVQIINNYSNPRFNETRQETSIHWVWDTTKSAFTWTNEKGTYFLGSQGTYTTISVSLEKYFDSNNHALVGTLVAD